MTFLLPDLSVLLTIVVAVAIVGLALSVVGVTAFFVANHRIRVAEREPVVRYYRQLAFGH